MRRVYVGLFLISLTTLLVEVLLTRIFDVLLWPNVSFMIISCALFGLGLGGVLDVLHPAPRGRAVPGHLAFWFALSVWALPLDLNAIPFSMSRIGQEPLTELVWFLVAYLVLILPFALSGLCICRVFSMAASDIHRLYFWDLTGAAAGTALLLPLLRPLGPERVLLGSGLAGLAAAALLTRSRTWHTAAACAALLFVAVPFIARDRYLRLALHDNKRDVETAIANGRLEFSSWDHVSQIAVIDQPGDPSVPADRGKKHIAYDGGTQSSNFYPFDGDFERLRRHLPERLHYQFWQKGVLAAHYLRRDTGHTALIIGSAGGQETKAALLYGASRVDAVEMVGTVVHLATGPYAAYIGYLFNHPNVHVHVAEGRTFLRTLDTRYDVIQIFSNYTSSSMAVGSGALTPMYLQTEEAYEEYFSHLKRDGILQINHHTYPRMITTAAAAWRNVHRTNFRAHVIVVEQDHKLGIDGNLPTVLIKMSPWTAAEVSDVQRFFSMPMAGEPVYHIVENPLDPVTSFLPDTFYSGQLPPEILKAAPYDPRPVTDDRPAFGFMRRSLGWMEPNRAVGLNAATASLLNGQLRRGWLPMDSIHLVVPAIASLVYGLLFVLAPMMYSRVGRERWTGKSPTLVYFALLGVAFIGLEVLFIQVFMHLIGFPLYSVTVVITVMLIGAGLGSMASRSVLGPAAARWYLVFIGVVVAGLGNWFAYPVVTHAAMALRTPFRAGAAAALLLPQAFFMGMAFPLGISQLRTKPVGAIAWAWSINGLCSTFGSVAVVALSLWLGFRDTILVVLGLYVAAGLVFAVVRQRSEVEDAAIDSAFAVADADAGMLWPPIPEPGD